MLRKHLLTSTWAFALFLGLSLTAASCGGSSDDTTKFVGPWTFQSGQLAATCLGMAQSPFSLAGLPVTFSKVDDSTISLSINTGCNIKFHVSGNQGTVAANQMCTLDLGGALGMPSIAVTKWTLTLSGDRIDNDIAGSASICTAAGTAVLVRGAPDAGVRDGGHDATGDGDLDTNVGGGPDATAGDTAPADAASDGGVDADAGQAG